MTGRSEILSFRTIRAKFLAFVVPLVLRSPLSTVPAGIIVPAVPQRSPPSLFTTAACGGLGSPPDGRPRRALLHLSYSCAAPFGLAILVTHDPQRPSR